MQASLPEQTAEERSVEAGESSVDRFAGEPQALAEAPPEDSVARLGGEPQALAEVPPDGSVARLGGEPEALAEVPPDGSVAPCTSVEAPGMAAAPDAVSKLPSGEGCKEGGGRSGKAKAKAKAKVKVTKVDPPPQEVATDPEHLNQSPHASKL